jgi:hypothetical protein
VLVAAHPHGDRSREVLASILAGAIAVVVTQFTVGNRPGMLLTPASSGVLAAGTTYLVALLLRRGGRSVRSAGNVR